MMMSLFSVFDPSIYSFFPWLSFFFFFFFFSYYKINILKYFFSVFINFLSKEFISNMKSNLKNISGLFILSGFFFFFLLNFFSLFPSVFTVTGHMSFSFFFSISLWLMMIFFFTINNFISFFVHLVPMGTPVALMSFMVLVELVSSIIRPITLSVRLTANMVAGHLLMSLLGSFFLGLSTSIFILLFSLSLVLTVLELAVSFIQGYVFFTLLSLYSEETH